MRSHLSLLLLLFIAACAPAAEEPVEEAATTEADVEAINAVREQEVAAINAEDIEGFLACFTDDAVLMPPNEPPAIGEEAMRSWSEEFLNQFTVQGAYTFSDVVVAADWAFERYSGNWTLTPKAGGEPISDNLKGIHIYQRQADDSWKITWDTWNSDNPVAPSSGATPSTR